MKVVVAIDSLKGSLSSMEAGKAIEEGILRVIDAEIVVKPLADGGEGTTEAFVEGLGGELVHVDVMGPMEKMVKASYGYIAETKTAIMEMAAAAGIMLVSKEEINPYKATTYGLGEMIKDAIAKGCRDFIVGIGGSATNDGGVGMLTALGAQFLDENGLKVGINGEALGKITGINVNNMIPQLKECHFKVACDVNNPLCGTNGATYIYGPQKGVTPQIVAQLDKDMANYAKCTVRTVNNDYTETPGAGAAGGLGYAFLSYLNTSLESGVDLVINAVALEASMENADYVITGEGRLDYQTAMGKAPIGVAKLAKKHGATVIAFAGSLTDEVGICNDEGIDAFFSILTKVMTLDEAMKKEVARKNIMDTTEQVFRLITTIRGLEKK